MLRYDLCDGPEAIGLSSTMRDLYAEVYAEPPYCEGEEQVRRFVEHFTEEVKRAGFSLARAVDDHGSVGAVYGWTMVPGQWFSAPTSEPPTEVRGMSKFAIMEWMVRRRYRGAGIGRHLLDLVLANRPEPFAILASNPIAPARRIYERMGWWRCGGTEPAHMPPMDILVLSLKR